MKIYVATKWENRENARKFMDYLENYGHEITYDWTIGQQVNEDQAIADMAGVVTADVLVFLADKELAYTGALIEVGAALGCGKRVYVLGDASVTKTLFFKHPLVRHGKVEFEREVLGEVMNGV